jgi:hypothetical protein
MIWFCFFQKKVSSTRVHLEEAEAEPSTSAASGAGSAATRKSGNNSKRAKQAEDGAVRHVFLTLFVKLFKSYSVPIGLLQNAFHYSGLEELRRLFHMWSPFLTMISRGLVEILYCTSQHFCWKTMQFCKILFISFLLFSSFAYMIFASCYGSLWYISCFLVNLTCKFQFVFLSCKTLLWNHFLQISIKWS